MKVANNHEAFEPQADGSEHYDLSAQIGHLLRRAYQRHTAIFQEMIPDDRLTSVQFAVLVTIEAEGEAPLTHIGRATAIDHATLRGIVARLKERGLVDIHHDTQDRRQRIVSLTPAGVAQVHSHVADALRITELTLAPLDACERVAALHILKKLAGASSNGSE